MKPSVKLAMMVVAASAFYMPSPEYRERLCGSPGAKKRRVKRKAQKIARRNQRKG